MDKKYIAGFPIHLGYYQEFVDEILRLAATGVSAYVCVAAVHQLIEAYKDRSYSFISHNADLVTPDGMPLSWALKILYNINQERVAGMDLLPKLLEDAEEKGVSVFFYGGTTDMLVKARTYVNSKHPLLHVAGYYSPPFRVLTQSEDEAICKNINESGAQLVFVVLGCPKQERWMASMKNRLNATMVGIGGALPVMIGIQKRAPYWMQKCGLEWFYRLCQEPRRLLKRYLFTNSLFIFLILKQIVLKRAA